MKKIIYYFLSAVLIASFFCFVTVSRASADVSVKIISDNTENTDEANASSDIEIIPNAQEHTIAMPYEKSFLFKATIKNHSKETWRVQGQVQGEVPENWHLLAQMGVHELLPGQQNDFIAVFEPDIGPGQGFKEETVNVPIIFTWEGGSKKIDVLVKTKQLPFKEKKEDLSKVAVSVIDKTTNKPVPGAFVLVILPSGLEQFEANQDKEGYLLSIPSGDYLKEINEEYKIDQESIGYFFQVSARGYKSYFESNFLPEIGESKKQVFLEPLDQVGEYELRKTIKSGYSIWRIRASQDNKYFAFSQGAHERPGQEPALQTKVLLANDAGEVIWEKTTGGECWGLDISFDGQYVAAGCHDGKIYVWNRQGNMMWQYDNKGEGTRVRWVKFSPDNLFLLSGPVDNTPEKSGLFEVSSGKLLWSFYTGDWLRQGQFSFDGQTVYLASANGTLYALDVVSGEQKWLGTGDYVIPFLVGISKEAGLAITAGEGRAFTALDLISGQQKWQTKVDQTIMAGQTAQDGSTIGSTAGGMSYGLDAEGQFIWVRQYGGVGHNGVHYTQNGQYALLGGPNPTLFDNQGNILWQREADKLVQMTSVQEQNTGGANVVWMSDDSSMLIIGQDDGDIQFYQGEIKKGPNTYSQLVGPFASRIKDKFTKEPEPGKDVFQPQPSIIQLFKQFPVWLILIIGIFSIVVIARIILLVIKVKKKKLK